MRRIIMLVTLAGRRLAADGVPFIGSRYARRVLVLSATLTAAMLVGLLGYANSSRADVTCSDVFFCMEKTSTPDPVTVGETLTFTIRAFCATECSFSSLGITDTLPAGLDFVSASATGKENPTCNYSASTRTVTCAPTVYSTGEPFEATIKVIPRECGTFKNTATDITFGYSASDTFTVNCLPTLPTMKEQCKKGGWEDFGYPDQGTCISDVNRRNR
jgi:uncharacterized repeat protein (TIGR01451 family)